MIAQGYYQENQYENAHLFANDIFVTVFIDFMHKLTEIGQNSRFHGNRLASATCRPTADQTNPRAGNCFAGATS